MGIKQYYILTAATLALGGCNSDNFSFTEVSSSCTPPRSSARYGYNQGPVITSPDINQPFNGKMEIQGQCAEGLPVQISGSGIKDIVEVECPNGEFSGEVVFSSGDGAKEIDVSQKTGNLGPISDRLCFQQDSTPPSVKITAANGALSVQKPNFELTGICESGLPVRITGPDLETPVTASCHNGRFRAPVRLTGPDGLKNIVAEQKDRAGNKGEDDEDFLTDTIAPIVRITSPEPNSLSQGSISLAGDCESGLPVLIQGPGLDGRVLRTQCQSGRFVQEVILSRGDGSKNLVAQQSDIAGNIGQDQRSFEKDATPPALHLETPNEGQHSNGTTLLTGGCETGLAIKLSGTDLANNLQLSCRGGRFSHSLLLNGVDGLKHLRLSQIDLAGNLAEVSRNLVKDTTPPNLTITAPAAGALVQAQFRLTGNCESPHKVKVDGAGITNSHLANCTNSSYEIQINLSAGDGMKPLRVSQTDLAGNSSSVDRSFLVDRVAPRVTILSPIANSYVRNPVDVSGLCESGLSLSLSGDLESPTSVPCQNGQFTTQLNFISRPGAKRLIAAQTDLAGNKGEDQVQYRMPNSDGYISFTSEGPGGKADILFVDDNSASMEDEQKALADRFSSFTSALAEVDWQIGVTTTDCSSGPFGICGTLIEMPGTGSSILKPNTPNFLEVFRKTIQRPETFDPSTGLSCRFTNTCPSANEQPLLASIEAMNKKDTDNLGFFRQDSDLAIVILSDEDEKSFGPDDATKPEQVLQAFSRNWAIGKKFISYGIIVKPHDQTCLRQQRDQDGNSGQFGHHAQELAEQSGGSTYSICQPDYSSTLRQIGEDVMRLTNSIDLDHTPIPGTVKLVFTPSHNTNFTLRGNRLTFETPAPFGTKVEIFYDH